MKGIYGSHRTGLSSSPSYHLWCLRSGTWEFRTLMDNMSYSSRCSNKEGVMNKNDPFLFFSMDVSYYELDLSPMKRSQVTGQRNISDWDLENVELKNMGANALHMLKVQHWLGGVWLTRPTPGNRYCQKDKCHRMCHSFLSICASPTEKDIPLILKAAHLKLRMYLLYNL